MVQRTGRHFTPYDARELVEQTERASREIGAWVAR